MQKYSVIAKDLLPRPEAVPPFREVGVYLITDVLADHRAVEEELVGIRALNDNLVRVNAELTEELETERIRLAGCGVAAMANTEETRGQRIDKDSPYWSASYGDVCTAVDREMSLREERDRLREQVKNREAESDNWCWIAGERQQQIAALTAEVKGLKATLDEYRSLLSPEYAKGRALNGSEQDRPEPPGTR